MSWTKRHLLSVFFLLLIVLLIRLMDINKIFNLTWDHRRITKLDARYFSFFRTQDTVFPIQYMVDNLILCIISHWGNINTHTHSQSYFQDKMWETILQNIWRVHKYKTGKEQPSCPLACVGNWTDSYCKVMFVQLSLWQVMFSKHLGVLIFKWQERKASLEKKSFFLKNKWLCTLHM